MAANEEFVISVNKNNSGYYRVHTIWKPHELAINVASDTGAWTGSVSKESLAKWGQMSNTAPDKFLEDTKTALSTPNGLPDISYSVENNSFTWKRTCGEDGVRIKLGSVPLEPARFPQVIQNMMSVALATNQRLEGQIQNLERDKRDAESNIADLLTKLEAAAKLKNDMETDMLGQFVAILNAKKNKISVLEEELIKNRSSSRQQQKPRRKQKGEEKHENNPYEQDTDEEMPLASFESRAGPSRLPSNRASVPAPSTPKPVRAYRISSSDTESDKGTPPRSPGLGTRVPDQAASSPDRGPTDARIFDMDVPIDPIEAPTSPDLSATKEIRVGNVDSGLHEMEPISSSPDLVLGAKRRLDTSMDENTPDNIVNAPSNVTSRVHSPVSTFPDRSQDVLSFFFGPDSP